MVYYLTHYMLLSILFTYVFTDNNVIANYIYASLITIMYLVVMDYLFRFKQLGFVFGK